MHQLTIYPHPPRIAETLPEDVLAKMYAPPKPAYPILAPADLAQFDAFVFGIPTRFGNFPAQWKAFWDATGQLWASGALVGKFASIFVSTASAGGGQETTAANAISTLVHHGINFVPFGYGKAFGQLTNLNEVHGGTSASASRFVLTWIEWDGMLMSVLHRLPVGRWYLRGPRRLPPAVRARA